MHARLLGDYICFPYLFFFLILDTSTGPSQSDELQSIYHENTDMFLYTLIQQLADPLTEPDTSFQDPFRSHLEALNAKRLSNGSWTSDVDTPSTSTTTPYAYSLSKSFWLPSSPSYFILASSTTAPNTSSSFAPSLYLHPRFDLFVSFGE